MLQNVILDVDTGIDDAVAILLAIQSKNIKVNLISCCFGNTSVDNVTKNTLNVLNFVERTEIPVARGEEKPIFFPWDETILAHGKTGLGEYQFPPIKVGMIKELAVDAMKDAIMKARGKTTIIALGPLTNVAKLVYAYPCVVKKIKMIVISGGLLNDNKRKPYIGFNIAQDVYSAEYLFNSKIKILICPSDCGHKAYLSLDDQEKLAQMNKTGKAFKEIFKFYKDRHVTGGNAAMHDACAVACVTKKKLFKFEKRYVYLRKVRSAGASVIDFDAELKKKHIVAKVAADVNIEGFKKLIFDKWEGLP